MAVSSKPEEVLVSKDNTENANTLQINHKEFLKVKTLNQYAKIPTKATTESIGYDLYATNHLQIPANDNKLINTGLAMSPPKGTYIRIAPRSGLALKHKLQVDAGVIDPDYTGEIKVLLSNRDTEPFQVNIGDKIAQINLENAKTVPIQVLTYLKNTDRGEKGFGSSNQVDTKELEVITNHSSSEKLIVLPKIMERPPGCSFIGSTPTTTLVHLGEINGPTAKVIIDSGSDITLVSAATIASMPKPPKKHEGKKIKLSQVTAQTTISGYVDLPLIFNTNQGPVQTDVEAYIVNGMTTPLILGNDFADLYQS